MGWMSRVKLRCIMGYPGLKSSYREKGLFVSLEVFLKDLCADFFARLN